MYRLHGFFTQNSMKPHYVLEELGVDFEFCFINLATGEHRSAEFLAMTPMGRVPVLEHDGRYLFESGPICRYLASVERSPLFPEDPFERAQVDAWMTFFTCHPGRWLTRIFFERRIKPVAGFGDPNERACEEADKNARLDLSRVDDWLSRRKWLANDRFSIAEPFALAYLEQHRLIDFPLDEFPHVSAWFDRLEARDATLRARARVAPYREAMFA